MRKGLAAMTLVAILAVSGSAVGADAYRVRLTHCGTSIQEDEAAHVRLVRFDRTADGVARITYRCERKGY